MAMMQSLDSTQELSLQLIQNIVRITEDLYNLADIYIGQGKQAVTLFKEFYPEYNKKNYCSPEYFGTYPCIVYLYILNSYISKIKEKIDFSRTVCNNFIRLLDKKLDIPRVYLKIINNILTEYIIKVNALKEKISDKKNWISINEINEFNELILCIHNRITDIEKRIVSNTFSKKIIQ